MMKRRELSQARAEETRKSILQTALQEFAERGYDGTSIREIAKKAETTHSMITYHFGGKEELWREAVRHMFARLDEGVDVTDEVRNMPIRRRFAWITREYVRHCARHPEHARITIAETIRGGERLEWMVDQFVRDDHSRILPMFRELMDEGLVPQMPLPSLLYSFVGMAQLPFVLAKESKLALDYDFMDDAAIEAHADAMLNILMPRSS